MVMVFIGDPESATVVALVDPPVVVVLVELLDLLDPHADRTSAARSTVTVSTLMVVSPCRRSAKPRFFMLPPQTSMVEPAYDWPRQLPPRRSTPRDTSRLRS